ncbi:hypothetical protein [Treponema primitia]|uniref:hypothetical protein n=1 Tax=Treponema primitia TaxID=88058 RepID=UPI0002555862|nr:hypothetical protein [Treponema primitia]
MIQEKTGLGLLSTRSGFNSAVRYIKKTVKILETLETGENLSDILREPEYRDFSGANVLPLLRSLLMDKLGYQALSANPAAIAVDLPALAAEFAQWEAVDLVAAFHDPRFLLIANPKNAAQLTALGKVRPRELLTVYAGNAIRDLPQGLCLKAAETAIALFSGSQPDIPPELYTAGGNPVTCSADFSRRVPRVKMTPLYSVAVTNELFHNGNVEAWKRIIQSYNAKYPTLKVHVYYGDEPILDINSLFTWGKVKHGGSIQFAVSGSDIRDVARLRRYLAQGSSSKFEPFLESPEKGVLKLF